VHKIVHHRYVSSIMSFRRGAGELEHTLNSGHASLLSLHNNPEIPQLSQIPTKYTHTSKIPLDPQIHTISCS